MPAPLADTSLGQVALTVTDVGAAVAFYRDVLGLPLLFEAPPSLAFFRIGEVRLMLSPPEPDVPGGRNAVLYLRTADIEGVERHLREAGVPFDRGAHLIARLPDHDLWMAFFRDPSGNLLALMEERKPA